MNLHTWLTFIYSLAKFSWPSDSKVALPSSCQATTCSIILCKGCITILLRIWQRTQVNLPVWSSHYPFNANKNFKVTISLEKIILRKRKRALHYIHPCTLYVGFMVRVAAKLRC